MAIVSVGFDISGVDPYMNRVLQRLTSASATALTKGAQLAEKRIKEDIARVFDRPTRWALNSTRVKPATRTQMFADVWLKNRKAQPGGPSSYLWPQVVGGRRERKGYEGRMLRDGVLRPNEFTVPAKDAPLDAYGNVPASVIRQMLSQLGAANAADNSGYNSNVNRVNQGEQSKARQRRGGYWFVSHGKSTGHPLPAGIYRRRAVGIKGHRFETDAATGKQRKVAVYHWKTEMMFVIVRRRPTYHPRLPFFSTVNAVSMRDMQPHFDAELARISTD